MTIQTIDELLDFIDTNYERLSNKAYIDICRSTMHLYEYKKPDTKEVYTETGDGVLISEKCWDEDGNVIQCPE